MCLNFTFLVWFIYPLLREDCSGCHWHGATLSWGFITNLIKIAKIFLHFCSGTRTYGDICKPVPTDCCCEPFRVRMSDPDCSESARASEPELCDPASNTMCFWHCKGDQTAGGSVSVKGAGGLFFHLIITKWLILLFKLFGNRNDQNVYNKHIYYYTG